jgi:hypothetical protein
MLIYINNTFINNNSSSSNNSNNNTCPKQLFPNNPIILATLALAAHDQNQLEPFAEGTRRRRQAQPYRTSWALLLNSLNTSFRSNINSSNNNSNQEVASSCRRRRRRRRLVSTTQA